MILPTNIRTIQGNHDAGYLARQTRGSDSDTIMIGDSITVQGLVDNETDTSIFQYAGTDAKMTKRVNVLGRQLAPYIFGRDYKIGDPISINGDNAWQLMQVIQSPDGGNLVELYIQDRN